MTTPHDDADELGPDGTRRAVRELAMQLRSTAERLRRAGVIRAADEIGALGSQLLESSAPGETNGPRRPAVMIVDEQKPVTGSQLLEVVSNAIAKGS